ncbi:MAG: hypothetical protein Kow009_07440 [Spirochaetales bacterium]
MKTVRFPISVEISYYPLVSSYGAIVSRFLERLQSYEELSIQTGSMSTVITGEYETVFQALQQEIRSFMEQYPSVFTLKVSNSCPV